MVFLQGYGVSPALAARIYKRYGAAAVERVRENPYRLAFDVWGIGFLSADRLAASLGIGKETDMRIEAGVRHVLEEAGGQGHVYLPREKLAQDASLRLEVDRRWSSRPSTDSRAGARSPSSMLATTWRCTKPACCAPSAPPPRASAASCTPSARSCPSSPTKPSPATRKRRHFPRASPGRGHPPRARRTAAGHHRRPGRGQDHHRARNRVDLPALQSARGPGRAHRPRRQAPARSHGPARRHPAPAARMAPREGMFGRNRDRPLEADLLVVDEASMVDIRLCADLVAALADGTRLLLVGDQDQLPSVGPGMVLRDTIASGAFPWFASTRSSARPRKASSSPTPTASTPASCPRSAARPRPGRSRTRAISSSWKRTIPRWPRRPSAIWWSPACPATTAFRPSTSRC
jgi:exodeoxyribonuclease V alpha subunit